MEQRQHHNTPFVKRSFNISVITDGVQSPANLGGLLRLLEAFGVPELYCCNTELNLNSSRLKRSARSAEKNVQVTECETALQAIEQIKNKQARTHLIGLEITANSAPLSKLNLSTNDHITLVLGGEVQGISEPVLKQLDNVYHIEMYGSNSSMNVTHAAGICLYSMVSQLL